MLPQCIRFGSYGLSSNILILTTLVNTFLTLGVFDEQYPHDFNYTINPSEICNMNQDIKLLIMVHSACNHFDQRLTIRRTWGSVVKRKDVRLLFLLGLPPKQKFQRHILDEDGTFGDILQEDFLDTYNNLTLKTIMMVKWVTTHCPGARHVLKIDDDCFLNPDAMLTFLDQNLTEVAIYGRIWYSERAIRNEKSKWYMPIDMFPGTIYPDFTAGPSYLLTQKAVPLLYATTLTTKIVHLEDVYINGICAEKANIPRINNSRFYVNSYNLTSVNVLRTGVLTSHQFDSKHLKLLWWLLHDSRGDELDRVLTYKGPW